MLRFKALLIVLAALFAFLAPLASAQSSKVLEAKWWPSANAFAQGQTYPMVIRLLVTPGMHINSNQPDDPDLISTKIKITSPDGLSWGPPAFPAAKKIKLGFAEKSLAVFDGVVLVRIELKVAKYAKLGDHQIKAQISFQGCDNNMCFMPETREVPLTVEVVPAGQTVLPLNRDLFAR